MTDRMPSERAEMLMRLPMLLNASLEVRQIVKVAIHHLRRILSAEAVSVFLVTPQQQELEFWALEGGEAALSGKRLPITTGIVGWCLHEHQSALVSDPQSDPRFFDDVDKRTGFKTREILCVPFYTRAGDPLGAVQALNPPLGSPFSNDDLLFLERVAPLLALALENARLVEMLDAERTELKLLQARRNEMLDIVTHEIRTPLNVVQTAAELLSQDDFSDPDARSQMRQTITRGIARITALVQSLRQAAVATLPSLEVQRRTVAVSELFSGIVQPLASVFRARDLRFSMHVDPPSLRCECDPSLISIAVRNLLHNAIRFTSNGGSIELHATHELGLIAISVMDTGIGVPPDQQSAIFDTFYTVGSSMTHSSGTFEFKSGGLGLGLPTVRAIVAAHGGELLLKSAVGVGSTFTISLRQAR